MSMLKTVGMEDIRVRLSMLLLEKVDGGIGCPIYVM